MLSGKDKQQVRKQLNAIIGQAKAIQKMISEERDVQDIYIQFKAVEGILDKAIYTVLDELFRKRLASKLVEALEECPGECAECDKVEFIKNKFSEMDIKEVVKALSLSIPEK